MEKNHAKTYGAPLSMQAAGRETKQDVETIQRDVVTLKADIGPLETGQARLEMDLGTRTPASRT